MNNSAISVAGFGLSGMVKAITSLYQVTEEINTWVDKHLQEMQLSDNLTISRTGKVLEGAKYGFGIGFIAPIGVIAVGQYLLGNPLDAAITIATGVNPLSMTCAAIGAIYFGWNALSDAERQDALDKLSKGLEIGIELIKSLIIFVIGGLKDLLDSKHLKEFKEFIKTSAVAFNKNLSDITRTVVDKAKDAYEKTKYTVAEASGTAMDVIIAGADKAVVAAGEMAEIAKTNAEVALGKASDIITDARDGLEQVLKTESPIKKLEDDKNKRG